MRYVVGRRLYEYTDPGSLEAVDTYFIHCFWPRLERPTAIFTPESRGILVMGPPTPRNVVFPRDTVGIDRVPDASFHAEQAVMGVSSRRSGMINLTDKEAEVFVLAYEKVVGTLPSHHTRHPTRMDCHFLIHKKLLREYEVVQRKSDGSPVMLDGRPLVVVKRDEESYTAELSPEETDALLSGKVSEDELRATKEFCHAEDDPRAENARKVLVSDGKTMPVVVADAAKVGA